MGELFKWLWLMGRLATSVGRRRHHKTITVANELLELDPDDELALEYLVRSHAALGRERESRFWKGRLVEVREKASGASD